MVRRWNRSVSVPLVFHLGPAKRGEVEHPQSLALSQKSESVPLGPPKNNIPPHPRATAPLWPCVGFSWAGWKPAPPGPRRRRRSALREHQEVHFSAPVQFALWAKIPHPLDVGYGSRIKRRVITPAAGHTGRQSRPGKREFSEAFRPRLLNLHKEDNLVKLHP